MSNPNDNCPSEPTYAVQPEYPPAYGEDGLSLIEDREPADGIEVAKATKSNEMKDTAVCHMEKLDEERAERVARRRNPANPFLKAMHFIVPYGGIMSSGFNLASSTLGAGIIALPAAFQTSGLAMGTIYLVVVAAMVVYSLTLLSKVGERTGLRSYEKATRMLLGRGADYLLAALIWLLCFGGDVSYVISMMAIVQGFITNSPNAPEFIKSLSGVRLITSLVWLVAMLPLCLPKEINSLRVVSTVALIFIVYFVICMTVHASQNGLKNGVRGDLVYFQSGNRAIQGLSIFMFAYVNQVNCFEVFEEQHKPSVRRMTLSGLLAVSICFTLYFLAGIIGYLDFGPAVEDSVLKMYNPVEDKMMGVAYAGIILKICVGYGLHMIPCRDAVYHVCGVNVKKFAWWKNSLVCGCLAVCSLIAGLFIPRITTVFGLLGALCGGSIGYVFPALMFMYCGDFNVRSVGWGHYLGAYFLLIVGVIAVVFGTVASIYGEIMANLEA